MKKLLIAVLLITLSGVAQTTTNPIPADETVQQRHARHLKEDADFLAKEKLKDARSVPDSLKDEMAKNALRKFQEQRGRQEFIQDEAKREAARKAKSQ